MRNKRSEKCCAMSYSILNLLLIFGEGKWTMNNDNE